MQTFDTLEMDRFCQRQGNHNIWYSEYIKKDPETYQLVLLRSSGSSNVTAWIIIVEQKAQLPEGDLAMTEVKQNWANNLVVI